jgi:nitrile hydratase accessory protein
MIDLDGQEAPAFSAPWEATAFAIAVQLRRTGRLDWAEWASTLGTELRRDSGDGYYDHWLATLETLLEAKGLVAHDQLTGEMHRIAYELDRDPHGHQHSHDHDH